MNERIILCIPGPWGTEAEFRAAFACESPDFELGRGTMMERATEVIYRYELTPHDDRMRAAFESTSGGRISAELLDQIANHVSVVYVIQESVGPKSAAASVQAAEAILDAGGFAVKVETAGVSFAPEVWRQFAESDEPTNLYTAFVAHAYDSESAYSCGMHNLGLADSSVEGVGGTEAARLLEVFNLFHYLERPSLVDGVIFAPEQTGPRFRLAHRECTEFPTSNTYHNPFGVWELKRAA